MRIEAYQHEDSRVDCLSVSGSQRVDADGGGGETNNEGVVFGEFITREAEVPLMLRRVPHSIRQIHPENEGWGWVGASVPVPSKKCALRSQPSRSMRCGVLVVIRWPSEQAGICFEKLQKCSEIVLRQRQSQ
jgi:hypothetical protein